MTEHLVNLPACAVADVLCHPPAGHRGFYAHQESPPWSIGDVIIFTVYGDVEKGRGIVTGIVPPGEDDDEWRGWWKTSWREMDVM